MPDYQLQEDEEFIRRNYSNNQNHVRKVWRQNLVQNNPVLLMEAQENRTCILDSDLQVSPSGRIRTNLSLSQNVTGSTSGILERRTATGADNEPRMLTSHAPAGYPASNLNSSSFLMPSFSSGSPTEDCDHGALSVVSGYQSCATEALRYLVEEEGLSPDDPLVAGLRQHLGAQQRRLDPESALRNYVASLAQRLMNDAEDSDECDDLTDTEALSESDEDEPLRHLASSFLAEMSRYGWSKANVDECDAEPEVRWFEPGAPPTYEPMCEDYSYDVIGAPSPTPSI